MLTSRTSRLSLLTLVGAALASASLAPAASADTQRHASPTGSDAADCSPANPCSINKAVAGAGAGDEVIVSPGDYQLTKTLATPAQITIHGVAGQPRPRLLFSGPAQNGVGLGYDSLLRYVEIDQAAPTFGLYSSPGRIDQVIVRGGPSGPLCAVHVHDSLIRDSIVVAPGSNTGAICATAILGFSSTSSVRNVTAIATGGNGYAIRAEANGGASKATLNLINVIASGGPGGTDLAAATINGGAATINAAHSNYGTESTSGTGDITNGGGNQLFKAPLFVNAAAGDYRQAAGSPTIDAGVNEPLNGAFDFEGEGHTRRIGTTDIGADEFPVPPTATTGPAGAVTGHSATLSGSVIANAMATSYHFEWGPTTAYGNTTPSTGVGNGLSAAAATAALGGLSPATTYHYRIVASNDGGVTRGADQSFTTVAPARPPAPTPRPAPTPGFAGVKLVSTKLTMAGRFITLKLTCPGATVGGCSGRTTLTARHRRPGSRATSTVALGRAPFSIAAGKQAKVKLRVSRPGRRLLGRVPRLRGNATSAARDAAGQYKTTLAAVTIRRGTAERALRGLVEAVGAKGEG
jgi:hypothetical protein